MDNPSKPLSKTSERRFSSAIPAVGMAVLVVVFVGLAVDRSGASGGADNFFADVVRMDNVAVKIHQNYVEEVSSKDLVDNAIKGMMQILDPHTSYFEAKEYEDLRMQTEGKFGGLGIQISIRDKVLTVMTPISGTPAYRAGIQSGDQIIRIDGVSTRGITSDKAVTKLRGEPGTEVRLTIRRRGAQDQEFTIRREIIHIKSVPFSGVLDNNIGYIALQQFSQEAGAEVERAIRDLTAKGVKGLIFDLRHNPGGLLPQAIEVSEKFLPRQTLVVSTRGRMRSQNRDFLSSVRGAALPADIPLVILVDRASASASEIVAGAVQDWDRGVILGDTTFGKGSVQSILQLDAVNHIKLTTAFYYTPAGRNINRPENFVRNTGEEEAEEEEEGEGEEAGEGKDRTEAKNRAKAPADTTTYRTKGGRVVYGGGGIVPDTVVTRKIPEAAIRALLLRDIFFQFANVEYVRLQGRGVKITENYQPDSVTIKAFYAHLDSVEFTFQSFAQLQFEEFKKRSGVMEDTTLRDNPNPYVLPPKLSDADMESLTAASARVDSILAADSRNAIKANEAEIRRLIRNALLIRELGQDHEIVFRSRLANDEQLAAAMGLLTNGRPVYDRLLKVRRTQPKPSAPSAPTSVEPPAGQQPPAQPPADDGNRPRRRRNRQ